MPTYALKSLLLVCCLLACVTARGADKPIDCLDCHTPSADVAVHAIMNTVHGQVAGGGNAACQACHGKSVEHSAAPTNNAPEASFGPNWPSPSDERSAVCLSCHENEEQLLWTGSEHHQAGLGCESCHSIHQQQDLSATDASVSEQCASCHQQVRAELRLPSRHPILEGKTSCTDCHNPHGGLGDADLRQVTLNDNCFSCHQDKRGPFLWEHPPVAEDCALCHRPHGSVHDRLLVARGPALCQQCHAAAFHPSVPYGGEGLPGGSANQNLLGKNCLNCHGQVHGSNHPSGARLTR